MSPEKPDHPNLSCADCSADLTAFVQGELEAGPARELEDHLSACASCAREAEEIRSLFGLTAQVEDLVPSLRFKRSLAALVRGDASHRESLLDRVRLAGAFLMDRLRTSPRFRVATFSVAFHAVLLLLVATLLLPGITNQGPHEFVVTVTPPTWDETKPPVRPDSTDEPSFPGVEVPGPHPGGHEPLFTDPPNPDAEFARHLRILPPSHRVEYSGFNALFGSTLDDELKTLRLGAFLPEGRDALSDVRRALTWLAREQRADGSWEPISRNPAYRIGVTSTALLAFLSDGHSTRRGREEWSEVVERGVTMLLDAQLGRDQGPLEGLLGPAVGHYTYNHAIATLALVETWCLDHSRLQRDEVARLRRAIHRALLFIVRAQTPAGGWRYQLHTGEQVETDTSVSLFMVMALASARQAGFAVREDCIASFAGWLSDVTGPEGIVGYQKLGDREDSPRTLTAGALYVEELLGLAAPLRERQAARVMEELSDPAGSTPRNGLLRFFSSLAFRLRGEKALRLFAGDLLDAQESDGSWSAASEARDLHAVHAGDSFLTALNVLTLTSAYRWPGM